MKESGATRTVQSVRNIAASAANRFAVSLLRLITKMVFVRHLSDALYGISGLFSNVLGLLALADLGISSAISFSLYRPIADGDDDRIAAVMALFRKAYRIIACVILALGLAVLPFLPYFIKTDVEIPHLSLYYVIYLGNMAFEYFFSYRRTLATAAQEGYRLVPFTTGFEAGVAILQTVVLLAFYRSSWCYLLFLIVQSLGIVIEDITVNRYLDRVYPLLRRRAPKLPEEVRREVFINVRALFFHKVGSVVVSGTDQILISALVDLVLVGYYGNYASLILAVSGLIYLAVNSTAASFGNLFASQDQKKARVVFRDLLFLACALYGIGTAFFLTLFPPFIALVYGERFLLSEGVVVLVVATNFYLLGITQVLDVVKSAAGLYDPDKWAPVAQSAVNLVVSIVLGHYLGLVGIFLGTLVSTMIPLIVKPIVLYRHLFRTSPVPFFTRLAYQIGITAIGSFLAYLLVSLWSPSNLVLQLLYRAVVTAIVAVGIFFVGNLPAPELPSLKRRARYLLSRLRKTV